MRIFIDLDRNRLVSAPGFTGAPSLIEVKRGDASPLEVIFARGRYRLSLVPGSLIRFALKERGRYESDPLVYLEQFGHSGNEGDPYVGLPNYNTIELNQLLLLDGDPDNDVEFIDVMGELTWSEDGGATWTSSETFRVRVANDVIKNDETSPVAAAFGFDGISATSDLLLVGEISAQDTITIGDFEMNFDVTGSADGGRPNLLRFAPLPTAASNLVNEIAQVINGEVPFIGLANQNDNSPVTAEVVNPGRIRLTAKVVGEVGNQIAIDPQSAGLGSSTQEFLTGGEDPRSLVKGDFVQTLKQELSDSQAQNARENILVPQAIQERLASEGLVNIYTDPLPIPYEWDGTGPVTEIPVVSYVRPGGPNVYTLEVFGGESADQVTTDYWYKKFLIVGFADAQASEFTTLNWVLVESFESGRFTIEANRPNMEIGNLAQNAGSPIGIFFFVDSAGGVPDPVEDGSGSILSLNLKQIA